MEKKFYLRPAKREETPIILKYIKKIAAYEKLLDQVKASVESLDYWIFERKLVYTLFAMEDDEIVGFVLYFYNFSTFEGKAGLYVEDIYIDQDKRGRSYGKKIFTHLAKLAIEEGCTRMEWVCLDWNQLSIEFYKKLGAYALDDWSTFRMEREEIEALASK